MCGICGIVDFAGGLGRDELARLTVQMRDALVHRGPDDAGLWIDDEGRVALGHRRLSIVDLRPEARQPMGNEDGRVQVVFNGEIYGFAPIKARLELGGHRFRTRSDTEILPHLFEDADAAGVPSLVDQLDGMFAFGLWDAARRRLVLARDAFGKKPLYWMLGDGYFAFASELRSFRSLPGLRAEVDREALAEYLLLQYCHAPRSIWTQVRKLPPGCCCTIDFSGGAPPPVEPVRYWRFAATGPARRPSGRSFEEETDRLQALVIRAIEKRLMSDVPLGAFLSGGVDSSLVVAIMRKELGRDVETFSIGFADTEETEHEFARRTANLLGARHRDDVLRPNVLELVYRIGAALDEPNGDSSCLPTYLLCQHARRYVTVALSGDGGDELFGGYGRYRDTLSEWSSPWRRFARRLRGQPVKSPADLYLSPRWLIWQPEDVANFMGGLPDGAAAHLAAWREALDDPSTPLLHRMRTLDAETYMPGAVLAKVDRMSMLHSLEVRCPLLDKDVAAFAMGLSAASCWRPPAETKRILKALASRYLPPDWMQRRKMGFGVPSNSWSPDPMITLARDLLLGQDAKTADLLDRDVIAHEIEQMVLPGRFSIYRLWPLLVLELWLREQGRAAAGAERA